MKVKVHMLAFGEPNQIREVEIPDDTPATDILGAVFYYGQNDFQPVDNCPSVSMADVIEHDGKFYRVDAVGFSEMSADDMKKYRETPRRDRQFWGIDGTDDQHDQ